MGSNSEFNSNTASTPKKPVALPNPNHFLFLGHSYDGTISKA